MLHTASCYKDGGDLSTNLLLILYSESTEFLLRAKAAGPTKAPRRVMR